MNYDELIRLAREQAEEYLSKDQLGHDEELQLLSCGYSILFLSACAQKSTEDLAGAHLLIAKCFEKVGDKVFSSKHVLTYRAYKSL